MNDEARRSGGCLCGSVRYSVPAVPMATLVCHCRNCQKQSGSALSVIAVYPRDELDLSGDLAIFEDKGTSGQTVFREFCGTCGSPVLTDTERAREQGVIFIKAGTFDEFSDLRPTTHYWVKRAHPWLPLPPDVEHMPQE